MVGFTACVNTVQSHTTKHYQCHMLQNTPKHTYLNTITTVKIVTQRSPKRVFISIRGYRRFRNTSYVRERSLERQVSTVPGSRTTAGTVFQVFAAR